MGNDEGLTADRLIELWRRAFGEPPAILLEPAQMIALIEEYGGGVPAEDGA